MTEFEYSINGILCIIRVTDWEGYIPPNLSGHPDNWAPSEGGEGEWEVLDSNGKPAPWLEAEMTEEERVRIDEEVFERMENQDEDY